PLFICLFPLVYSECVQSQTLIESGPVVKKPLETVKLSCKASGFTITDIYMHWIRQKSGKGLEWIDIINSGSNSATYSESLKGKFTLTEIVSINTQFLEAKILRSEDSEVYYCAGQTQ
uniref:Ig-like domain-containing protein n=1 Tax=Hucho hucho TaxID=62062 RepID=A0A4W5M8G2_9TELE